MQLNYIIEELNSTESAALGPIKGARSPAEAARLIDGLYERSDNILDAESKAETYYRMFAGRKQAQRGGRMTEHGFARGGKMSIAHVGDSIAKGTRSPLTRALKKMGIHGRTQVSIPSSTAVGYLRSTLRDSDDAIVFDAGTNDTSASTLRSSLSQVLRLADDRPVIVPATRGTAQAEKNAMLDRARGIEYVPWSVSMGDSVHPSGSGYVQRASKLARIIRRPVRPGTGEDAPTPGRGKRTPFWDPDFDASSFFGLSESFQRGGRRGFDLTGSRTRTTWRPPADDVLRQGASKPPKKGRFVAGRLLPGRAEKLVGNISDIVEGEADVGGGTWQQVLSNLSRRTEDPRHDVELAGRQINRLDTDINIQTAFADRTEEDFVLAPGDPGFDAQTSAAIHKQLGTPGWESGTLPYVDDAAVNRRVGELTKIAKLYFKQANWYRTLEQGWARIVRLTRVRTHAPARAPQEREEEEDPRHLRPRDRQADGRHRPAAQHHPRGARQPGDPVHGLRDDPARAVRAAAGRAGRARRAARRARRDGRGARGRSDRRAARLERGAGRGAARARQVPGGFHPLDQWSRGRGAGRLPEHLWRSGDALRRRCPAAAERARLRWRCRRRRHGRGQRVHPADQSDAHPVRPGCVARCRFRHRLGARPAVLPSCDPRELEDLMPDVMRVVEVSPIDGDVTEVLDLQNYSGLVGYARERDTFEYTPPVLSAQTTQLGGMWGGQRAVAAKAENGRVAATFLVRGTDVDDCLARTARIVSMADEALLYPNRCLEWRSELASEESYYEIRGPGIWTPTYSSTQMTQESMLLVRL